MDFHLSRRASSPAEKISTESLYAWQFVRSIEPATPQMPLAKVVFLLRKQQLSAIPVVDAGFLLGWITETRISERLLADNETPAEMMPIGELIEQVPFIIDPATRFDELIAVTQATNLPLLSVATADGIYRGCVMRSDLLAVLAGRFSPPRIGGMATPLGVYLTTGVVSGGAGNLGLVLSGVMMTVMYWVAQTALQVLLLLVSRATGSTFLHDLYLVFVGDSLFGSPNYTLALFLVATVLLMGVFMLILRIWPRMAGFHAAEHQTVNAIEAGEPLTPESVARMSRVHPRCGTNLWGIMLLSYLGVAVLAMPLSTPWGRENISMIVTMALAIVIVMILNWRRLGGMLQLHLTTRRASAKEIASGIRAGEEIIQRHLANPQLTPTPRQQLLRMGLVQVAIGVMLTGFVLQLLDVLWHSLVK